MRNINMFCVVVILIINLINCLHGASLNGTVKDSNDFESQLERQIRQTNVEECTPPIIPNGNTIILKRKSTKTRIFLSLNVTCDYNYILQPSIDHLMSCFNGFWDVDEVPQCKKCIKRPEITSIDDNIDSKLICPVSLNEISVFTDCGHRIDKTHQPFVVNGTFSKFAEFPWHVGIYKKDQIDTHPKYHCGGSIINEKRILSVAHCFSDVYGKIISSREYYAAAGKYHRNYNSDSETTQKRKVVRTDLHPRYKGELTNYAWDIAIIVVDDPFETSILIHPICIDWKNDFENEQLFPDKYGEVAGWGKTEINVNAASPELRVLKVPFVNIEQCNKLVPSTFIKYITHDKICAGNMNGSSVCDGDSGGGLVFERQEKGETKYYIRGLVSVGLQKDGRCDDHKYSTYTKVSEYISFIRESIQNNDIPTTETSLFSTTTNLPESVKNLTNFKASVSCKTPNNEEAKCISIYDCKIFVTALQNTPSPEVINFMKASICGKQDERKVCCGSTINYFSVILSNPVTTKPIVHNNLNLLPPPGVCGRQIHDREGKIYGGEATTFYDYPWMALLEFGTPEKSAGFLCAGSLINERYVMTAAHCAVRIRVADLGQVFRVRLGEYDLNTNIDCVRIFKSERICAAPPVNVDVESIHIHPLYDSKKKIYDIALLRLAENITYTDFIKPICLPLHGEMSVSGKKMTVVGWGQTETERSSPIKLKTSLYATSNEACAIKYKTFTEIFSSHICVINEIGSGECRGDTGGPLMTTLTDSKDIYAEGVMSFGISRCGTVFPSVATRVIACMDWILNVLKP